MIAELVEIQRNPKPGAVTIEVRGTKTIYTFPVDPAAGSCYYYPRGIRRITIARGGAGVVYVYTTDQLEPHLTIPDSGSDLHWTTSAHTRSYAADDWPNEIRRFVALFP
jgi:hypothetical protein